MERTKWLLSFKIILLLTLTSCVVCYENKYTEEANINVENYKDPFRMGKLNLLWEKSKKRLSAPKMKKLLSELKIQDQEELTFKKLKSSGGDKHGLKEGDLRRRLLDISTRFGLESGHKMDTHEKNKADKALFKDKKLNKLWEKAEKSGLTQTELKALKDEFHHHQDKVDEYHLLVANTVETPGVEKDTFLNDVTQNFDMESTADQYQENVNKIRTKHHDLKKGIDHLHRRVSGVSSDSEFKHPKVIALWKMAQRADFDQPELDSLHTELKHYEGRLEKIDFLENEMIKLRIEKISDDDLSTDDKEKVLNANDTEGQRILSERLAKQKKKINTLHEDIEMRIVQRHSEF